MRDCIGAERYRTRSFRLFFLLSPLTLHRRIKVMPYGRSTRFVATVNRLKRYVPLEKTGLDRSKIVFFSVNDALRIVRFRIFVSLK